MGTQEFNIENKIAEGTKLIREMFDNTLTKRQMDLIYAIISLVKPTDTEFYEYTLTFKQVAELYNPKNNRTKEIKECVKEATNQIMDSHFQITSDEERVLYHWVEKCRINDKEETIKFKLSKEVQQFYLQLNTGEFTLFLLKDILALSTVFQSNLFRWLCCNSGFDNAVQISIDDAKLRFYGKDIETRKLVVKIDAALEKINDTTNIRAGYTKIKKGKTIIGLKFYIKNKYAKKGKKEKKPLTPAQRKANEKRNKEMWQRNLELRERLGKYEEKFGKDAV